MDLKNNIENGHWKVQVEKQKGQQILSMCTKLRMGQTSERNERLAGHVEEM